MERSDSDHFGFSVRNVYSAQNQFPVITQAERMVDRTGEPVEEMIAEERESSSAQIRTLFNEQRKTIIAECCEKVSHHELQLEQNKNANFYRKNYGVSNRIFVKFINKILLRWRNYENSQILPSIRSPDRSSSRTRTLLWNYQAEYKNYKMK